MATKAADLYDQDFYAWTQQQADVIRSLRGDNRLDVDHLAEEIEDLGKSELHACESWVEQIMAHLLKLDYASLSWPRKHWTHELHVFRRSLLRRMTPSLERKVRSSLDDIFKDAKESAAAALLESEPGLLRRLPEVNPYDWDDVTKRDVLAEAGLDRGAS